GGAEASGGGGGGGAEAGGGNESVTSQLGIDQAVDHAIDKGASAAADALGEALGLDADGGGGESNANEAGPVGNVDGVDATDRAKGPGHLTSKIGGSYTEQVGSLKVTAALNGVFNNVAGDLTQT